MKKILIVDDSNTARMVMRRCLEIAGGVDDLIFFEAGNGKEALSLLKKESADLVVTDLNMPDMDGESLLKKIKASPKLNDISVVVITSVYHQALEEKLIAMGALAVLNKPISPSSILSSKAGSLFHVAQAWDNERG